jgi:hypothetical protein
MEPAALEELWKQAKEEDPVYLTTLKVNDKVGLSYWKQLYNGCPNKKLDWKNAKYTVTELKTSKTTLPWMSGKPSLLHTAIKA